MDLPLDLELAVNFEDIGLGVPLSSEHCPIARAFLRTLPNAGVVVVGLGSLTVVTTDSEVKYDAVAGYIALMVQFMTHFDKGYTVVPETFRFQRREA